MADPISERQVIDAFKRFQGNKFGATNIVGVAQSVPVSEDWLNYDTSYFAYTSSTRVAIAGFDATLQFQKGDKIRIKFAGDSDYRYFYVFGTAAAYLDLMGGTDYVVANLAVEEFGKGTNFTPSGHPLFLDFDPQIAALTGGATYTNTSASEFEIAKFFMIGSLCSVKVDVTFGNMAGVPSALGLTLPIASDFLAYERRVISCTNDYDFKVGLAKIGGSDFVEIYADATFSGGEDFVVTSGGLGFNLSIDFLIA